jgi:hypothetical protein
MPIDKRTGREVGDHGTALQAINFVLDRDKSDPFDKLEFLTAWREGNLDEWPEYYTWLATQ